MGLCLFTFIQLFDNKFSLAGSLDNLFYMKRPSFSICRIKVNYSLQIIGVFAFQPNYGFDCSGLEVKN